MLHTISTYRRYYNKWQSYNVVCLKRRQKNLSGRKQQGILKNTPEHAVYILWYFSELTFVPFQFSVWMHRGRASFLRISTKNNSIKIQTVAHQRGSNREGPYPHFFVKNPQLRQNMWIGLGWDIFDKSTLRGMSASLKRETQQPWNSVFRAITFPITYSPYLKQGSEKTDFVFIVPLFC